MFRDHIEDQLPQITASTLVIRGGSDPTVPQSAAVLLTSLLPRGALLVIDHEPHCVHYTNPARVWQAIGEHDWQSHREKPLSAAPVPDHARRLP